MSVLPSSRSCGLQLIAKIQERNSAPTQNIQMISVEQRTTLAINVVTQSGATTHIQKQTDEAWVRKAPKKVPAFDIEREKETFMEAKRDFDGPSTTVAPVQPHQPPSPPEVASTDTVSTLSSFYRVA